jgi:hypothetical protein
MVAEAGGNNAVGARGLVESQPMALPSTTRPTRAERIRRFMDPPRVTRMEVNAGQPNS